MGGMVVVAAVVVLGGDRDADRGVDVARATLIAFDTTTTAATPGSTGDDGADEQAGVLAIRAAGSLDTVAVALAVGDGFLITSTAALSGHRELVVVIGSRLEDASVVGHDDRTDVSVIHVDAELVPAASAGDATTPAAGDEVTFIGPDGSPRPQTVAEPVASAALRDGTALVGVMTLEGPLDGVAPWTPALDEHGAIVGIAGATAAETPAAVVPIALARGVADEIIDEGAASHPVIGVTARDVTGGAGALVAALDADGPAAAGGIEPGDIIVAVGGTRVASAAEMVATLREHEPGDRIAIEVARAGGQVDCEVELESALDPAA